jgi:hypothetical protein
MRGIGEGEGDVINHKPTSRGGPALIVIVLAACSSQEPPPTDEMLTPDAPTSTSELACPEGVTTWRDALLYFDEIRCTENARCFPERFAEWYGDMAGCMAQLGRTHCKAGEPANWCDFAYPRERCALLLACRDEAQALPCDPDVLVPASCEDALH